MKINEIVCRNVKLIRIFVETNKETMTTLEQTKENLAKVEALKKVKETQWVGNITFENLDFCLRSINMNSFNGGLYNPVPIRINGLAGIFMVNKDGSLFYESRVIKRSNSEFVIEHLSDAGFNAFESKYNELA